MPEWTDSKVGFTLGVLQPSDFAPPSSEKLAKRAATMQINRILSIIVFA